MMAQESSPPPYPGEAVCVKPVWGRQFGDFVPWAGTGVAWIGGLARAGIFAHSSVLTLFRGLRDFIRIIPDLFGFAWVSL